MHAALRLLLPSLLVLNILVGMVMASENGVVIITGIVQDAEGKVVAGASVFDSDGKCSPVNTGRDGRFTLVFKGATVRYMMLIASSSNDELMGLWEAKELGPESLKSSVEVQIMMQPSKTVTARVADAMGQPVAGAKIAARQAYEFIAFAESGVDGRATLRVPADARMTEVVAMKPDVGLDYFENVASKKWLDVKPLPKEVTLILNGVSRFQLRAVDSRGKPIAGAEFAPWIIRKPGNLTIPISAATTSDSPSVAQRIRKEWRPSIFFPRRLSVPHLSYAMTRIGYSKCNPCGHPSEEGCLRSQWKLSCFAR